MSGRTQSNEMARSGHTPLGEHSNENAADDPRQQKQTSLAPVPEENQPGHKPEHDQDKPLDAFAERMQTGDDGASDGKSS